MTSSASAGLQVPAAGQLVLDHVGHFVPHADAASAALEKLGFMLTPFSEQSHRIEPGGPLTPAGAGNRCVMLRQGYLEFLTPTADTPVANQLRAYLRIVFPGVVGLFADLDSPISLRFLERFPSATRAAWLSEKRLGAWMRS